MDPSHLGGKTRNCTGGDLQSEQVELLCQVESLYTFKTRQVESKQELQKDAVLRKHLLTSVQSQWPI
jgi:hypothetical protein